MTKMKNEWQKQTDNQNTCNKGNNILKNMN